MPRGPDFCRARPLHFEVGGSLITFRAPRHRTRLLGAEHIRHEASYDIDRIVGRDFKFKDNIWMQFEIMNRSWSFLGPWLTGDVAELSLFTTILIPSSRRVPHNVSLFHPRAFEKSVGDYITDRYGSDFWHGRANWIAPVNWQPLSTLPTVGVTFDVMPDLLANNPHPIKKYVFFPVADHPPIKWTTPEQDAEWQTYDREQYELKKELEAIARYQATLKAQEASQGE